MAKIGDRIKTLRSALKLTQLEFAEKTGVSDSFVSLIENNKKKPSFELISSLASDFHVNMNWLFYGEGVAFDYDSTPIDPKKTGIIKHILELPDDDRLLQFLKEVKVPIIYYAFMAWWIKARKDNLNEIEEFLETNNEEEKHART